MTHKDIYTKFMIEYDKANVTSSYPSLTEYEVATVLDKAYNALIAQKVTGNNYRRSVFESDTKAIADLEPLINREDVTLQQDPEVSNGKVGTLPSDMLYFIQAYCDHTVGTEPMDKDTTRELPIQLVSHETATKFFSTPYNLPWVKIPVCFIEDGEIHVVHDPINIPTNNCTVVFIKKPNTFVKDLSTPGSGWVSYFDGTGSAYEFECNPTVAEELISLGVAFALENVESQRLNSKLNMRGLEA
jgi:hypothetical protein